MKKNHTVWFPFFVALFFAFMSVAPPSAHAQRVSDRDLQAMMQNLKEDSKNFRESFDDAVKKSTIRKTSQEKDAKGLVATFEKQTDDLLNEFKKTRKGDVAVESTISNAQEIERMLNNVDLSPKVHSQWQKVRTELEQISRGFGISTHYGR